MRDIHIDGDDVQLYLIVVLFSFVGWCFWEALFWMLNHIYIEWI